MEKGKPVILLEDRGYGFSCSGAVLLVDEDETPPSTPPKIGGSMALLSANFSYKTFLKNLATYQSAKFILDFPRASFPLLDLSCGARCITAENLDFLDGKPGSTTTLSHNTPTTPSLNLVFVSALTGSVSRRFVGDRAPKNFRGQGAPNHDRNGENPKIIEKWSGRVGPSVVFPPVKDFPLINGGVFPYVTPPCDVVVKEKTNSGLCLVACFLHIPKL